MDRELALEALSMMCNAKVTSVQAQRSQSQRTRGGLSLPHLFTQLLFDEPSQPLMGIRQLFPTVLAGDAKSEASSTNFTMIQNLRKGQTPVTVSMSIDVDEDDSGGLHIIDEGEFFDPGYDYDFTDLKDSKTYYRGGEVYERPCGWYRFALKVLDKYGDNTWLGNLDRETESVDGEWPVSYHGTSKKGAEGIIKGRFKPGSGEVYGRGIYSTPDIDEAIYYSRTFTSKKTGKTYNVILQNRINPKYREFHNGGKYWLVRIKKATTNKEEEKKVERAIRPYGLLLKEV